MSRKREKKQGGETVRAGEKKTVELTNSDGNDEPEVPPKENHKQVSVEEKDNVETLEEKINSLEKEVASLDEERAALQDQLLRKQADFENYRKRMFRDKQEFMQYANSSLLLDLTNTIDDFERAIKSAEDSKDFNSFHQGITLIEKQLVSMLEKNWNLKRFDSQGEEFDPEKHQAIATVESEEHETPQVIEDFQRGYMLHDRILRPAKVKVAKPTPNSQSENPNENSENKNSSN